LIAKSLSLPPSASAAPDTIFKPADWPNAATDNAKTIETIFAMKFLLEQAAEAEEPAPRLCLRSGLSRISKSSYFVVKTAC
jgi:hypothetical protein